MSVPQPLTKRQQEYLDFIRNFIQTNESAPRLDEIAKHLGVSSPTAHRTLRTLQEKGYLYFKRDSVTGFYIRLIEFVDISIEVAEILTLGTVDQFGIVRNFPKKTGHLLTPTFQSNPKNLFALYVSGHLPKFNLVPHDVIIFDQGKTPKAGDICLTLICDHHIIIQITNDNHEVGRLSWITLEENGNNPILLDNKESDDTYPTSFSPEFIIATALRLTRNLAY